MCLRREQFEKQLTKVVAENLQKMMERFKEAQLLLLALHSEKEGIDPDELVKQGEAELDDAENAAKRKQAMEAKQQRKAALELSKRQMAAELEQHKAELAKIMRSVYDGEAKLKGPQKPKHGYSGEDGRTWKLFLQRYDKINQTLGGLIQFEQMVVIPFLRAAPHK